MAIEQGGKRPPLTDNQVVSRPQLTEYEKAMREADGRRLHSAELRGQVFETVLYRRDIAPLVEVYVGLASEIITPSFDRWALRTGTSVEGLPAAREEQARRVLDQDVKAASMIYNGSGVRGVEEARSERTLTDEDAALIHETAGAEGLRAEIRREKRIAAGLAHKLGLH